MAHGVTFPVHFNNSQFISGSRGLKTVEIFARRAVATLLGANLLRVDGGVLLELGTEFDLEHDPEKCAAVFRKDHAQTKDRAG
jgi:hypothetical protein